MSHADLILFLFIGLLSITLIDTIGAIASRKFNFKYAYLGVLSCTVYLTTGYLISKQFGLPIALFANGILDLYDGTVGFWLSIILKASNDGGTGKQGDKLPGLKSTFIMIVMAVVLTLAANIFS